MVQNFEIGTEIAVQVPLTDLDNRSHPNSYQYPAPEQLSIPGIDTGIANCSSAAQPVVYVCGTAISVPISKFRTILFLYKLCVTKKRTNVNKLKFPIF